MTLFEVNHPDHDWSHPILPVSAVSGGAGGGGGGGLVVRPDVTTKPTNPKDAFGVKKASLSCVSAPVLMEVGVGMQEGACKYGRHNYRVIGVRGSVYYDATLRHLMSWWEGEDTDPDSGLSHITKAICSLVVLRDAMIQGKFNDDRPPKTEAWLPQLNAASEALSNKYPDPVKPYTQLDNSWMEDSK